jgi:hypothetical protein
MVSAAPEAAVAAQVVKRVSLPAARHNDANLTVLLVYRVAHPPPLVVSATIFKDSSVASHLPAKWDMFMNAMPALEKRASTVPGIPAESATSSAALELSAS